MSEQTPTFDCKWKLVVAARLAKVAILAEPGMIWSALREPPEGQPATAHFLSEWIKAKQMFENEIAVNEQLLVYFSKVAKEIPDDSLFHPSVGHGHPPVWILGHVAIVAEMAQMMLGGSIAHPEWVPLFGPGSSDIIHQNEALGKKTMISIIKDNYVLLRELAAKADEKSVSRPHNVAIFEGTPIKTVSHVITVVLTSHFGFHLSQLSSCRRTAGFGPLF